MSITVDSGAEESVADPDNFPGFGVVPHPRPIFYQSASGEPICNRGTQEIAMVTKEGSLRGMKFQSASKIKKPLAAVKRIVEAGHAVVFAPPEFGGSFILNMLTGEENEMRDDDGNYVLDVWIPPVSSVGFTGQP